MDQHPVVTRKQGINSQDQLVERALLDTVSSRPCIPNSDDITLRRQNWFLRRDKKPTTVYYVYTWIYI
jgi:hypothetical protein